MDMRIFFFAKMFAGCHVEGGAGQPDGGERGSLRQGVYVIHPPIIAPIISHPIPR